MILAYLESLLPLSIGIPGVKLGLPNLVVVMLLYYYGYREALFVNFVRILLSGFLFGSLFSILYALAGALCSFLAMLLLQRCRRFSVIGVSIGGGVFHNIGQLFVAVFVVETFAPLFYIPFLLISGAVTGFLIGLVTMRVQSYLAHK